MKKVLVTGGAGYIGAHAVVELFQNGYVPIVVDNLSRSDHTLLEGIGKIVGEKPLFFQLDCNDRQALRMLFQKHEISCVLHFAAYKSVGESVASPLLYYDNNIGSLLSLLQVQKEFGVNNFIFSSSCTVYGQPDSIPVAEDAPFKKAESPYGVTKQMCEQILMDAVSVGFKIISLRYFNPIGAHPSALIGELPIGIPNNLIPYLTQTAAGQRKELIVFGNDYDTPDGTCVRDFIHVLDLAKAHVQAMEYLARQTSDNFYQAFNLGTGVGTSVLELIQHFERATGVKVNYRIGARRSGDVVSTYADPRKIKEVIGWTAHFGIGEALMHSWAWQLRLGKS